MRCSLMRHYRLLCQPNSIAPLSFSSPPQAHNQIARRGFYITKKLPITKEQEIIKNSSNIINVNPVFAADLCDQLAHGGREALSRKIFREHIRKQKMPPDLVIHEFCKLVGRDPETEIRIADKNQSGYVSGSELKEWFAEFLVTSEGREKEEERPLTFKQQYAVFVNQMAPFIGFGFMDNVIMILAGDHIDMTLGLTLGLSTMAAAGLGNLLSDVCGVGFGGVIESATQKLGLPPSNLTPSQTRLPRVRVVSTAGQVIGVIIGCLIGMTPLLFLDHKERKLRVIFDSFDADGNGFIEIQELTEALKGNGISIPTEALQSLIEAADSVEKDGKLEFQEFKEFMTCLQEAITRNQEPSSELVSFFRKE